jgi:flagellar protein FliS
MDELQYLENQVLSASPYQLHLMVIDGALRFSKHARIYMEEKDWENSHLAVGNAQDFISELICGLKDNQAPEVVANLKALFVFAYRNLVQAELMRDTKFIDNAIRVLEIHRETWVELQQRMLEELGADSEIDEQGPVTESFDSDNTGSVSDDYTGDYSGGFSMDT